MSAFAVQNGGRFPEILTPKTRGVPWNLTFRKNCPKDGQNQGSKKVPQILTYVCTGRKLCSQAPRGFCGCEAPKSLTFSKSRVSL